MFKSEKLEKLLERFQTVQDELANNPDPEQYVKLSKEFAELNPIAEKAQLLKDKQVEKHDLQNMIEDSDTDLEMLEMAKEELLLVDPLIEELEQSLQILLLPKDADDDKNVIVEIRAGTGGDEAALFAGDLFRMYSRYADLQGWKTEIISASEADMGGYKEICCSVNGKGVFANLKFESGVHRVQRVPETESGGRIHTSAATVAVLPEAQEVDIDIDESELRVDYYRASGPGGQSVNTTDSAVRIAHLPTGVVVTQQDEKSQHKNKAKAMKVLRSRLYELERQRHAAERAADRKGQVGSGDRSERIRTYNFPQGRVTDHRINLTLYKLDRVIQGDALSEIIEALITEHQAELLAADAS